MAHPDDEQAADPLDSEPAEHSGGPFDFVRRMAAAGLGAVFMSEEGIRRLSNQLKLPKEAMGFLLTQAEKTKDDIGRIVSEEVRKFLQSDRLRDELLKMVAGMTIEVKAEVRLVPDRVKGSEALVPKVTVQNLRVADKDKKKKRSDDEKPQE